jgi:arylsulfatase A-like enzyme
MVELMDLGATLVELAGGDPVEGSRARSLTESLHDPTRPHRQVALSELRQEAMAATADWKLAVNRSGAVYMLYDLGADPQETRNLAGLPEYEDVQHDLWQHLQAAVAAGP